MGFWNVVQYYSSTEETAEYKCMRSELEITDAKEVSSACFHLTFRHNSFVHSCLFVFEKFRLNVSTIHTYKKLSSS